MRRIILAAAMALASAPSAHASVCTAHTGDHWYAILQKAFTTRADHGAAIELDTTTLTSGSPGSEFVDHEMWYGVNGNCTYWVEVGVIDGRGYAGETNQSIFWADNRANGLGFHEHYPAVAWSLGVYYQARVAWAGNNSWNVFFGGVHVGTSTHNYYGSSQRCLEAGIEASRVAASDHDAGHMTSWQRKDTNNVWYHDWNGATTWSHCPLDIDVTNNVTTEVLHGPNH
jgi:hypothetical protein